MTPAAALAMDVCALFGAPAPDQLETRLSGADYARWIQYFNLKNNRWERIEYMIAQLSSLVANLFSGVKTGPEDFMPVSASDAAPSEASIPPRELARQLALSMGAEIRYKE